MKLFVYQTFKCKVIIVEFLSRDPLNNSAIMCEIITLIKRNVLDRHSIKKIDKLKYLILETPYAFFSIYSASEQ